jgi:NhaP-type Na+/H+ or K+/H+ antiporter
MLVGIDAGLSGALFFLDPTARDAVAMPKTVGLSSSRCAMLPGPRFFRGVLPPHDAADHEPRRAVGRFAAAQAAGGSGFIACFVGGLLLSGLGEHHEEELLRGAEHMGEALALLTWIVFGGIVVARMIDSVTWPALLYAVLSLTVVRMLPVFLCLIGTRTSAADELFIGWFGPRGLATIVFAILVLDAKLPGNDTIMLAAGWTVLLSVIAHGVTANPLVKATGSRSRGDSKGSSAIDPNR